MADNLDIARPIVEIDPATGEFKATPYFETYLYDLVAAIGGEAGTLDHTLLNPASIGTNTHAQIDTHITAGDAHIALTNEHLDWTADQGATDIHTGNYTDWSADQGATNIHSGNYTDTTDHTALDAGTIGVNTHAQIDTAISTAASHISDSNIHLATATTAELEAIANAVNTDASKILGYPVRNTTTGTIVFASGAADGSVWHF